MAEDYIDFLNKKKQLNGNFGFEPNYMPDCLFDFQKHLVEWSLRKGKSAIFAECGLGKTIIALVWAENVVRKTKGKVLILTPLAVAFQFLLEGDKFGINVTRGKDGKATSNITVTNYQQLDKYNPEDFDGIVCDESSAIKNFTGATKKIVTRFLTKIPYRLLDTATPSPNDFVELGTSSEALGELSYMEMCSRFFRDTSNDKNPQWSTPQYILKGHAVDDFWQWVSSWAIAIKKPSDLGYSDDRFALPKLIEKEHILECSKPPKGEFFAVVARTLKQQRQERKLTINERVAKAVELCEKHDSSVIWAHYNYETDLLTKEIPGAVQVSGKDSDEEKEQKFIDFASGKIKRLVIKPVIGAWGLNWQHCNHMITFPSHSYEQYYQSVRRLWRFGQKRNVYVDVITTNGEEAVMKNIKRKSVDAAKMFDKLNENMNKSITIEKNIRKINKTKLPKWV